jgi:hypothetical protein
MLAVLFASLDLCTGFIAAGLLLLVYWLFFKPPQPPAGI